MKPTLVILAAGLGSRYGGLKQMDKFGPSGETILEYSIFDAIRAGFGKVVFVIRETMEEDLRKAIIEKVEDKIEVECVFQQLDDLLEGFAVPEGREKPWGTGHAILAARKVVDESAFAVINADDFYGQDAYRVLAEYFKATSPETTECAMVGFELKKTVTDYGSVSRGVCSVDKDAFLLDVVERTKIIKSDNRIYFVEDETEFELTGNEQVSMNFWGFQANAMKRLENDFIVFLEEKINVPKSEFYIPWAVNEWIKAGISKSKVLSSSSKWFGVTYQEDREMVKNSLAELIKQSEYPENLWA